jgi:hypothetical protein
MALHPNCTDDGTFRIFVTASETLVVAANGRHAWALGRLLQEGYRVEQAVLRMVLKGRGGEMSTDGWVDISRWADKVHSKDEGGLLSKEPPRPHWHS